MTALNGCDAPLISCLCVTENRTAFMPWLLWNYDRQSWQNRELVIVDSSAEPVEAGERSDIRVVRAASRTTVGQKRNVALEQARGDIITWFDDDDWQHPEKLALLHRALQSGKALAGCTESWFLDFARNRCARYKAAGRRLLFNSIGVRTDIARSVRFPTHVRKASDTRWMQDLERRMKTRGASIKTPLFFWLCHGKNLSNPVARRRFDRDATQLNSAIGNAVWGDTNDALYALRERMEAGTMTKTTQNAVHEKSTESTTVESNTAVTAVVKATVLDAAYLGVMLPHMLRQAKFEFAERIVVVDPRLEFEGKYRARVASSRVELDAVLNTLLDDGEIDRVVEVPYEQSVVDATNTRWFGRTDVPTHACTGGPIYPTLWGIDQAATDYVLQFDADVFFHSGGESWVKRAVECMQTDSSLWLMMTHPGPPAGPVGKSIRGRNSSLCRWDSAMALWRFSTATTRYFLCDRRRLRGCLQPVRSRDGCAPLEQCISQALKAHRAYRGALGGLDSWHLHAWSHADPFPAWAAAIAECVSQGKTPVSQRGKYDLCLNQARHRTDWQRLIEQPEPRIEPVAAEPRAVSDTAGRGPAIVIPIRDRAGARVRNALRSINWQDSGEDIETIIVSHGSRAETDAELAEICEEQGAQLITAGKARDAWNKPAALNIGIRATLPEASCVMTMDTDMILLPSFVRCVMAQLRRAPKSMILCRSSDLPERARIPAGTSELFASLGQLQAQARLRPAYGCGGIQAASREFFFNVRGYDEDLKWWGAMDTDMVQRAKLAGLRIQWIEYETGMLHQWHPRKHAALGNTRQAAAARRAWQRNHALVKSRSKLLQRNSAAAWGLA